MNNKKIGTAFEYEFAGLLSSCGFWVHNIKDGRNGQPFDIVAAKNNRVYVFDCKVCSDNVFKFDRIEENQFMAMSLFVKCGNDGAYFALKSAESEVFLLNFADITDINKVSVWDGVGFEDWRGLL